MICRFAEYTEAPVVKGHLKLGGPDPLGERIDVTSKYLTKGDRPWLPVMGEYHFARASADDWQRELRKMKAGGIGIVATYLFWIYHQEEEHRSGSSAAASAADGAGDISFEGDLDIRRFVLEAQRAGLYVVLRLGPWAHGECRNGGFPDWLVNKPFKLRDNNDEYLGYVKNWYNAIFRQVKGLLYKDGGNIIGIQLENELTHNAPHLQKLKEIACEAGFDVPLYTVTGWNSLRGAMIPVDEVLPVFGAYPDAPWEAGSHKLPLSRHYAFYTMRNDTAIGRDLIRDTGEWQLPYEKYPFATCELGPGMQSTHHRRVYISPMDAYALSLVKLGCGNNLVGYYMFHGGTNKTGRLSTFNETKATGYPNDYPILNYDFGTCLSQYGEVRDSYRYLNLLHMFINDFGDKLAVMDHVAAESFVKEDDTEGLRYCMRRGGEGGFVFVNNHQRGEMLASHKNVSFDTGCGIMIEGVNVPADAAFILPFGLNMDEDGGNGSVRLRYATAQLLCRSGNTFFFMTVNEDKAVYDFEEYGRFICEAGYDSIFTVGNIRIVTLDKQEALYLRKLSGKVCLGIGVDLYDGSDASFNGEKQTCERIRAVEEGGFSYYVWKDDGWMLIGDLSRHKALGNDTVGGRALWKLTDCEPAFEIEGEAARQLRLSGDDPDIKWSKLELLNDKGFIIIDDDYDVIQIYCDGKLAADRYYDGTEWRVPASLLYGKECYTVRSF